MESKKINQLATNVNPQTSDLTTIGDPITGQLKKITWLQVANLIGAQASLTLQDVTNQGATTTLPITTGGLTLSNLDNGVLKVAGGVVSTYPYGQANGVASLDSGGKVPASQLPSSIMDYKGTWNAATNTPTLVNGTGDTGDVYRCNVAGTVNFGAGNITFKVGDWAIYNGTIWEQSNNSDAVSSVFGRTGDITAQEGDYNIGQLGDVIITSAATNDYLRYNGTGWVNTQFPTFVSSDKLVLQVRNNSGATINKGTVVYINGATAGYPTIAKAQADADATSAQTIGMVQDNISNNSNGVVVIVGQITGVDTSAYAAGTQLYLSGTTAGAVTSTKTLAPTHLVYVGIVTTQNAVNGVIEVKIQNGYELDEIHDVAISSVANNQGLFYESSTSLWKNKSIATVLGYTPEQPLTFSAPLSRSTNTVSIPAATGSVNGYLTSTDWTTFNNKLTSPMTTLGDIIFGGTSGNANRLAGNITTTKQYLSQTGTGTDSASPTWATIAGSDITGAALTKSDDTNVTLTLGGSPSTALLRAASLTLGWTGQLAISRGGTGASTKAGAFDALSPMTTLGDIIYGGASGTGTRLAGSTSASKRFLTQTGDGTISAAPAWGALASADIPNNAADTTGNAATATKLATARTLTIGVTGKTFDGSANVSWSLAEIGAEPTLTKGNLTETTSSVLTITGGTGAVIGSGTTIAVASAGAAQNGVVTTGTQTLAGAKTLTDLLTGIRVAMTSSITSGAANSFAVTQTQRNGTDTGDIAMSLSHTITASSASNQLVIRAMSFGTNNNLTGGGAVTNYRGWNIASSTQTGTTTTHLDQIYIERGTADGTVTNNRAIRINNMQGTNRAAFFVLDIGDGGTNNSYMVLGSDASATIPTGNWGIYQIQSTYNNYFNGKLLVKTTTDAGFALDVSGTARTGALTLTGALSGTSATFNVGSATTVLGLTGNGNGATIASITNTDTGSSARSGFQVTSDSATAHYFASSSTNVSTATGGRASTAGIFTASGDTAGGLAFLARNAAGVITFHTGGNTERMRLTSGGNVQIGPESDTDRTSHRVQLSADNENILSIQQPVNTVGAKSSLGFYNRNSNNAAVQYARINSEIITNNAGNHSGALVFSTTNAGSTAERFRISSTGAATFSNNVTLANGSDLVITPATSGVNATLYNDIGKLVSTASLVVNGTGEFSSSVTASKLIVDGASNSNISQIALTRTDSSWGVFNETDLRFYQSNSNTSTPSNVKMVITTAGNVGIGTTSPGQTLEVNGNILASASGKIGFRYSSTDANYYSYLRSATGGSIGPIVLAGGFESSGQSNEAIRFATNANPGERIAVSILNNGNVGIGTTSPGNIVHAVYSSTGTVNYYDGARYMIQQGSNTANNFAGISFLGSGGSDAAAIWTVISAHTVSATTGNLVFGTTNSGGAATERMRITSGGEVWINYTSDQGAYYLQVNGNVLASGYFESSDIRLKDVLTNSYSENFSAIEFMWKDKRDDKKHWGYAAQDVMKYIPDAIEVNNDGMMTVNYNEAHTWKIAQLEAKIVELEAKLK